MNSSSQARVTRCGFMAPRLQLNNLPLDLHISGYAGHPPGTAPGMGKCRANEFPVWAVYERWLKKLPRALERG